MKRKIFYSIEVECEEHDLLQFVELKRPSKDFCYEYTELVFPDIDTDKVVSDFFGYLNEIFKPQPYKL